MTAVHKANIMKKADGIFLESCQEVAKMVSEPTFHIVFFVFIISNLSCLS